MVKEVLKYKIHYVIMKMMKRFKNKKFLYIAFSVLAAVAFFFAGLQFLNYNKIIWGLQVAGIETGGVSQTEISEVLAARINEYQQKSIALILNDQITSFYPKDLGVNVNLESTIAETVQIGHRKNMLLGIFEQARSFIFGKNIAAEVSINRETMEAGLQKMSNLEAPARNAGFRYNAANDSFSIVASRPGTVINREKLKDELLKNAGLLSSADVILETIKDEPKIKETDLTGMEEKIKKIAGQAPYSLKLNGAKWQIQRSDIADWLTIVTGENDEPEISFDETKVNSYLMRLAGAINQKPVSAKLTWVNNELKFAVPAQKGRELDIEASAKEIKERILSGSKEAELAVITTDPEISGDNLANLGLTSLLGKGESSFSGSSANRRHNLTLGASKLNGLLIKPGETFSFGDSIGPIEAQNGYLPELVIKKGQTLPGIGGGVCQVSTTIFRAAINSGLKITERYPHAYPVSYYGTPGFDATVYPPKPDLKFVNDTPSYILLQSRIEGNKMIFEIYGTSDGRQVKIKGPTITQSNPDGSMKTILIQEIWRDGQLAQQNRFPSSYDSPSLYPVTTTSTPAPTPTPSSTPIPPASEAGPTLETNNSTL